MNSESELVRQRVAELLGRPPRGEFSVVVSTPDGDPVVIRNEPLLDDGTPMPTRYWLVSPDEIRRIGQLESTGGVRAAEQSVDGQELAEAHHRYAAERDAALPSDHEGPRPFGGVGGTRRGVKCLHSHWAWYLAGGDDPVGRWIAEQLDHPRSSQGSSDSDVASDPYSAAGEPTSAEPAQPSPTIDIAADETLVLLGDGRRFSIPWGPDNLTTRWLAVHDPPYAEDLTNALGAIDDFLDDMDRQLHPHIDSRLTATVMTGVGAATVMRAEMCANSIPERYEATRPALEALFRDMATQPEASRRETSGITEHDARTIIAATCIVLSFARRYRLGSVVFVRPDSRNSI